MLKRENERKPGKRRNNVLAGRGRLGYTYISVDLDFMKLTAVLIRRRGKSDCRDKQAFRMQRKKDRHAFLFQAKRLQLNRLCLRKSEP